MVLKVNISYLSVLMINHDVVWFDISVHNTHTVTEIQRLETHKNMTSYKNLQSYLSNKNYTQEGPYKNTIVVDANTCGGISHL